MNRLILAGVAAFGLIGAACADDAGASSLDNRSSEWKKNLGLAVNDETKVAGVLQSIPEADRAAFATDVLAVLQAKRLHMADPAAWEKNFSATAAALVAGSDGAKKAVLSAMAAEIVNDCVAAESRELSSGELLQLGVLAKSVEQRLGGEDRVAFANALLLAVDKQKTTDGGVHKLACSVTALSLFAGAGDAKKIVIAEVFAVAKIGDLGAVSKSFADAFSQRKNSLGNDDYLQVAMQILQAVATRTAGLSDASTRFAYAVAMFVGAAGNPAQFEKNLMGKLAELLSNVGPTTESFAVALASAKGDLVTNAALVQSLTPTLSQKAVWGVIILPPGTMLAGEEGPPFVHENRPPGGYQNQGIF